MMAETAEEISRKPEISKELQRATGEKRSEGIKARGRDKLWFLVHALVLAGCVGAYFILAWKLIPLPQSTLGVVWRILRGTALIVIVLAIARAISVYALGRIEDPSTRFTLQRIMHLVVALGIAVIAISIIFVNWYAALAAFGVGSIIIGLAVQTPMKSFIAWIYILIRQPFRVGDRIQIGGCHWRRNRRWISRYHSVGVRRQIHFRRSELEVRERPRVIFRVSENTWLEAIVRYLVPPREAGRVKTRLIKKLLAALNTAPDKVMFPAGANR